MTSIYLFSNRVVETCFKELVEKGKVNTTYGTDFDCVARKILEDDLEKAIVITDGIASMNEENSEALKEKHVKILTILYGGGEDCEEFEPFGPVVQLDESSIQHLLLSKKARPRKNRNLARNGRCRTCADAT